ncbi:unnamed protein product [Arctia plantaginis]|uniref:Lariat debranching enzyme C-terminal domain-containing protein n=1 Tax=Arctia plantaginis TaxID=874455 RepID=A0A8S1ATS6_ARCPL|nr:unnamed protein product [Arctia plantaginis]CAB3259976.1 unnamed protein product [Arctia plantaginis]
MKIAVEGCAHGELEKIYDCIQTIQDRENIKIDLLICCGDFQAVRNHSDLKAMAVPEKFQHMCSFHKYYSGEKRAPILTIFIGGNHEASNYLQELPYGGWVAPNIYYLGRAGVVKFGDLRIGGMSGIYKPFDYRQGLWEALPYTRSSLRTVYHVRSLDVFRLSQLKDKVDVMLSHDWPRGITEYGNKEALLKRKPFFREDIESNQLGSIPAETLLHTLKPDYWFAAHLHCQFAALVKHETNTETKFLALDKCLPKRRHLQILDIPTEIEGEPCLKYDVEWLAILKNTNQLLTVKNVDCHMPGPGGNERYDFTPTEEEKENIKNLFDSLIIKQETFVRTAPVFDVNSPKVAPQEPIMNPQTVELCEKLGIDDPVQVVLARMGRTMKPAQVETNNEISSSTESTPMKFQMSKLSLPAPVTPSNDDSQHSLPKLLLSETDCSFVSDNSSNVSECKTPTSVEPKKTFKRRNLSIYNSPELDLSPSTDSSYLGDSESPHSNKISCTRNDS